MKKNIMVGGALAGLIMAGGIAGMVSAQSAANATGLTEDQIIEIALSEVAGEVTEVEQEREDGQMIYEIEILTDDDVEFTVEIDAETGEVLDVEEEDDRDCDKDRRHGDHDDDHDDEDEYDDEDDDQDEDNDDDAEEDEDGEESASDA